LRRTGPATRPQAFAAIARKPPENLDQLDLLVFPVVLSAGKRLFSEPDGEVRLRLAGPETFGTGVVHLTYVPSS
jgi:hypothetical protein